MYSLEDKAYTTDASLSFVINKIVKLYIFTDQGKQVSLQTVESKD